VGRGTRGSTWSGAEDDKDGDVHPHACITKFTGKTQKAVLLDELKVPEGATLEVKPIESPMGHEQPTDVLNGSGNKEEKEEEAKENQQKESVTEATPPKTLN
jgi:thioredoxin reductase